MQTVVRPRLRRASALALFAVSAALLAACAAPQPKAMVDRKPRSKEYFSESEYGVRASPRVTFKMSNLPRGGGRDQLGKPYKVRGKWYYPKEEKHYNKVGLASWYGDAFHGRLDGQWRSLRHDASDGGASDDAAAELRTRHQSEDRQFGHRSRQRSRPLSRRPHHRPVATRRRDARLRSTSAPPR